MFNDDSDKKQGKSKKGDKPENNQFLRLMFPGDMERQMFIEKVINIHQSLDPKNKDIQASDSDQDENQEWDEEDGIQLQKEYIDEEPQKIIIYD